MQLEQVDVVGAQTLERALHREAQVSGREVQTQVGFVEVGADFGREDNLIAHVLERLAEQRFGVSVPVHVRRVEEGAAELECVTDRAGGLRVVGRAVRIAEPVAADRPGPETDFADGESGAAERAAVHASSSFASCSGVDTGIEHVVPTHTVAAGAAAIARTTTFRGR